MRRLIRWTGRLRWRPVLVAAAVISWVVVAAGWAAVHLIPLPDRLDDADSVVAHYHDGRPAHALLSDDDKWRFPTRLDDVDSAYLEALLALEDKRFYNHPGVDPIAVVRAGLDNIQSGSTVSGASTITMQLVRLLEPRPRTLRSKAVEALRAIQLEVHMTKEEILEAYLRFAPYGGNVEGIEAATLSFWGKTPTGLSSAEIATLLTIPQSPSARRPSPDNAQTLRKSRDHIALRLADIDAIPKSARPEELRRHLDESPVPVDVGGPPREIPHVIRWLQTHRPDAFDRVEAGRGEPSVRIETTLDRSVQRSITEVVARHKSRLRSTGAPHAAVVVMESETGQIRGVVGNLDFDETIHGSHVPAFASPRSTGSLLKPVAYAAALDEGLLAPSHKLYDVSLIRGDYRPENFDRRYRGLVEAEESLARSLNIPFVRLLELLSIDEFIQTLVRFEMVGPVRRSGHGGLELIIGGMPASALEVASLYAGLARGGRPVVPEIFGVDGRGQTPAADDELAGELYEMLVGAGFEVGPGPPATDESGEEYRAVSEAAAWLTKRALTRRPTPWNDVGPRRARAEGIIWKTGTSFSYHDAWTAGFGKEFTVAVWGGDVGFERHPELIGARVAAPLFFDVIHAIDEPYDLQHTRPDDELAQIEVCSRSGRRPTQHCPHTTTTEAPAKTAAPERCQFHVVVDIDADSGRYLPDRCRPDTVTNIERRVVERLPGPVARFERARGRRAGTLPEVHPDCRTQRDAALSITSPRQGTTVVLEPDRPADNQLVRLEAYSSMGSRVHWYIDGRHIESAGPDEPVYWIPEPGDWTIAAVDEQGTRDIQTLSVEGEAR